MTGRGSRLTGLQQPKGCEYKGDRAALWEAEVGGSRVQEFETSLTNMKTTSDSAVIFGTEIKELKLY
ncbi:hypothetical protein AAY473_029952 [Plecturocebus cupreus]